MIYARCSKHDDGEPSQVFVASSCVQVKRGRKVFVVDASDGEPSQVSHVESMRVQGDTQASAAAAIAFDGGFPLAAEVIRPPSIKPAQMYLRKPPYIYIYVP